VIRDAGWPTVGLGDRRIEFAMRLDKPLRSMVVERRQGSPGEDPASSLVLRQSTNRKPSTTSGSSTIMSAG
jgi:hypothetical protein